MAGVRLGYGLCSNRVLLDKMEQNVQPWNVSTMAQAAGIQALSETEYVEKGRQLVFRESQWLKEEMTASGIRYFRQKPIIFSSRDRRNFLISVCERES